MIIVTSTYMCGWTNMNFLYSRHVWTVFGGSHVI